MIGGRRGRGRGGQADRDLSPTPGARRVQVQVLATAGTGQTSPLTTTGLVGSAAWNKYYDDFHVSRIGHSIDCPAIHTRNV